MNQEIYPGIYRGVVEDINDPLKLGRCKIRVPSIHGKLHQKDIELLPWARYVSPLPTNDNKGMFIIPDIKDVVWVMFEGGHKNYPIYLGSTYGVVNNKSEVPLDNYEDYKFSEILYQSKLVDGIRASIKKTSNSFTFKFGNSSISIYKCGDIHISTEGESSVLINGSPVATLKDLNDAISKLTI